MSPNMQSSPLYFLSRPVERILASQPRYWGRSAMAASMELNRFVDRRHDVSRPRPRLSIGQAMPLTDFTPVPHNPHRIDGLTCADPMTRRRRSVEHKPC